MDEPLEGFGAVQIEVHPRYPQRELRGFCKQHSIAVVAYASLGCGDLLSHSTVQQTAQECARTPAQVRTPASKHTNRGIPYSFP